MQYREYRTEDKSDWGEGPWQGEPDKIQWQDSKTGLPCLIVRNRHGALCGYVGVFEGHTFFRKQYSDADEYVEVHGGLTYASFCDVGGIEDRNICHVPDPDEPDHVWWLGFDCNHAFDLAPGMKALLPEHLHSLLYNGEDVYRDIEYVKKEVTNLARQIYGYSNRRLGHD